MNLNQMYNLKPMFCQLKVLNKHVISWIYYQKRYNHLPFLKENQMRFFVLADPLANFTLSATSRNLHLLLKISIIHLLNRLCSIRNVSFLKTFNEQNLFWRQVSLVNRKLSVDMFLTSIKQDGRQLEIIFSKIFLKPNSDTMTN